MVDGERLCPHAVTIPQVLLRLNSEIEVGAKIPNGSASPPWWPAESHTLAGSPEAATNQTPLSAARAVIYRHNRSVRDIIPKAVKLWWW